MQRKLERIRQRILATPRYFAALAAALVVGGFILSLELTVEWVDVVKADGQPMLMLAGTTEDTEQVVRLASLKTGEELELAENDIDRRVAALNVQEAFGVCIKADGKAHTAAFVEGTVADLVQATGVALEGEDYVEPAAATPLCAGMEVQVRRVDYAEEVRREELDLDTAMAYAAEADPTAEFKESKRGLYDVTYRDRLVDGKVESTAVVGVKPLVLPRPQDSYTIEAGVPCSRIEGFEDIQQDENGIPLNYTRKWEGAITTAYSARGGKGSSGLGLYCGTVAVNPNVIPYGTRMYITSADGNFIYGFAIATDTGTAMMEGYVDIDIFFETNAECLQFGKRGMDVYILD